MSQQLTLSAVLSVLAMVAFALFATPAAEHIRANPADMTAAAAMPAMDHADLDAPA